CRGAGADRAPRSRRPAAARPRGRPPPHRAPPPTSYSRIPRPACPVVCSGDSHRGRAAAARSPEPRVPGTAAPPPATRAAYLNRIVPTSNRTARTMHDSPVFRPPETFNIADYFLDDRIREGRGDAVALRTDDGTWSYREVQALANRFGALLLDAGVRPEQRVIIALPDGPDFVGALFGTLKIGAVVVMVNPYLRTDAVRYFYDYTRAAAALVGPETREAFEAAAGGGRRL